MPALEIQKLEVRKGELDQELEQQIRSGLRTVPFRLLFSLIFVIKAR